MIELELPSTDLVDASATAEWYVPSDWTPPAMLTAQLPAVRRPRHPALALVLLFACVATCIVVVSFAITVSLAQRPMTKQVITVAPTQKPIVVATSKPSADSKIPTYSVDDLPRAKKNRR